MQFFQRQSVTGDRRSYKVTFPLAVAKAEGPKSYSFDQVAIALQEAIVRLAQAEGVVFTGLITQGLQIAKVGMQVSLIQVAVFEGSFILTPANPSVDAALKTALNQIAADVAASFEWEEVSISFENEKWQLVVGQNFPQQ